MDRADLRQDRLWPISEPLPSESQDDPAAQHQVVLAWEIPFTHVTIEVDAPIDLDGDAECRVGQIHLRHEAVPVEHPVVQRRLRESALEEQRQDHQLEIAVGDLGSVCMLSDDTAKASDAGTPSPCVRHECGDESGPIGQALAPSALDRTGEPLVADSATDVEKRSVDVGDRDPVDDLGSASLEIGARVEYELGPTPLSADAGR